VTRFIVLDRPNPLGGMEVAGPVLQEGFESGVMHNAYCILHSAYYILQVQVHTAYSYCILILHARTAYSYCTLYLHTHTAHCMLQVQVHILILHTQTACSYWTLHTYTAFCTLHTVHAY
jgi:hypothetical protein